MASGANRAPGGDGEAPTICVASAAMSIAPTVAFWKLAKAGDPPCGITTVSSDSPASGLRGRADGAKTVGGSFRKTTVASGGTDGGATGTCVRGSAGASAVAGVFSFLLPNQRISTSPATRARQAAGSRLTPGGGGISSGTKESGIRGLVGSTRYLSKSRSPAS